MGDTVSPEAHNNLLYHYSLVMMLANCAVGRINVTSLEAKLQVGTR
jgi:hypothetical protein